MKYSFPNDDTLIKYLALLHEAISDARARAHYSEPRLAALLYAIENVPDLLCRWPETREEIMADLAAYEREYLEGTHKYTRILTEGPREDWQLKWDWHV